MKNPQIVNREKMLLKRKIDNLRTRLDYGLNRGIEDELRQELWALQDELKALQGE